jgi:hypothetical protein
MERSFRRSALESSMVFFHYFLGCHYWSRFRRVRWPAEVFECSINPCWWEGVRFFRRESSQYTALGARPNNLFASRVHLNDQVWFSVPTILSVPTIAPFPWAIVLSFSDVAAIDPKTLTAAIWILWFRRGYPGLLRPVLRDLSEDKGHSHLLFTSVTDIIDSCCQNAAIVGRHQCLDELFLFLWVAREEWRVDKPLKLNSSEFFELLVHGSSLNRIVEACEHFLHGFFVLISFQFRADAPPKISKYHQRRRNFASQYSFGSRRNYCGDRMGTWLASC